MNENTEIALRNVLTGDDVTPREAALILSVLKGNPAEGPELCGVVRYKEVERILNISSRTLNDYIRRGYLRRVPGRGKRALGIAKDSLRRFMALRIS